MKSKQEVIQEAWGENWDLLFDSEKEHALQNDGWVPNMGLKLLNKITFDFKGMYIIFGSPEQWLRPKSLTGIETNNGWTRIESVDDLPSSGMKNYMYCVDGKPSVFVVNLRVLLSLSKDGMVSHYMALPSPESPIY